MKVAIITGASRGIGFETAKWLIKKYKITVVAVSRNISGFKELSEGIIPVDCDIVSNPEKLVNTVVSKFINITYLINNAGYLINKDFTQFSSQEAEMLFKVNYFAPAKLIRLFLPYIEKNGQILNITSMGGFQGSQKFRGLSHYSSSKAALACLTECLATELAGTGIHVNALALGAVETEMLKTAFPDYKAPVNASEMGEFIADFLVNQGKFFNGKIIPVSTTIP